MKKHLIFIISIMFICMAFIGCEDYDGKFTSCSYDGKCGTVTSDGYVVVCRVSTGDGCATHDNPKAKCNCDY
jgi:hypothetical protein